MKILKLIFFQDEKRDAHQALLAERGLIQVDDSSDEEETAFGTRLDDDNISVGYAQIYFVNP